MNHFLLGHVEEEEEEEEIGNDDDDAQNGLVDAVRSGAHTDSNPAKAIDAVLDTFVVCLDIFFFFD